MAERGVRVVKDLICKSPSNLSLKYRLGKILLQYRTVPHTTQVAPAVALNKRKLITMSDRLNPQFCSDNNDKQIKLPQFDVGSSVLALNLRRGQKWYDATVIQVLGVNVFEVHVHDLNVVWKTF